MLNEIWKPVVGFEGLYEVSNLGNVKGVKRQGSSGGILSPAVRKDGYLHVNLRKNGNAGMFLVHRLVAEAFIPNREFKEQVNHIDGKRSNNLAENLEWTTRSENCLHAHDVLEKNTRRVVCVETGIVYPSIRNAARCVGVEDSDISRICRGVGRVRRTKGFSWRYA